MYFSEYIFFTSGYWTVLFVQQITTNIFVCRSRNLFCNKEPAWVLFRHITEPEYFACTWSYVLNHACESFMVSRSRVFHSWCNVTVLEYFTFWDAYFYIINYINPTRSHPLVLCMWSVFDTSETVFFIKACIQSECMTHTNIYELFTIFFSQVLGYFLMNMYDFYSYVFIVHVISNKHRYRMYDT